MANSEETQSGLAVGDVVFMADGSSGPWVTCNINATEVQLGIPGLLDSGHFRTVGRDEIVSVARDNRRG